MQHKQELIRVRGARTHNLKGVDVDIPKGSLTVITGVSGSGKSSLAFDTLYAEGQRRYVQSLSAYTRQFLDLMPKPDVESIEGLSPAIAIDQARPSGNVRSTVATATEIADYLRLLFARAGVPYCPEHHEKMAAQSVAEMTDAVLALPEGAAVCIAAPVIRGKRIDFARYFADMQTRGYMHFRIDGKALAADELPDFLAGERHDVDVVVDRLRVRPDARQRIVESMEAALSLAQGRALVFAMAGDFPEKVFSNRYACPVCDRTVGALEPAMFSFNHPAGACEACQGTGVESAFTPASVTISEELSLADGAVYGFDRRSAKAAALIASLAKALGFDERTPLKDLPPAVRKALFEGTSRPLELSDVEGGRRVVKSGPFPGFVALLEARYEKRSSAAITTEMNRYRILRPCAACGGARLNATARAVVITTDKREVGFGEIMRMDISRARAFFSGERIVSGHEAVAQRLAEEIARRLRFLDEVGLGYLRLDRRTDTLSGGESQRVRLACQMGSGLSGIMYVLDEPSVGLHPKDTQRLLGTLCSLRDDGNTVIVVEHDEGIIRKADCVLDMGPGAGVEGGWLVAAGTPVEIARNGASLTGAYLSGARKIAPRRGRAPGKEHLVIRKAAGNNLKGVTASFPVGAMTVVTGVSGSGKSTLVTDTLYRAAAKQLYRATETPEPFEAIEGLENFDKVVDVDQSPIGRSPRSNPATYTGLFAPIRELFAQTPTARERGYDAGRFSFNVAGGRCEACQGEGFVKVEMHFLPDMYVPCKVCNGSRFKRETLEVLYKGKTIADVLELTVAEALEVFANHPVIRRRLEVLSEVGLGYVRLGQSALTLSGGEAQRMKLALELSRPQTGRTLYILDEPTTGLHFEDVRMLLDVLDRLRSRGNTIVVVEHNLDVIASADHVIDMGPGAGDAGGEIVYEGSVAGMASSAKSVTGPFLKGRGGS